MIVEDEDIIRENLKALLELEGYLVYTAANGREGLEILARAPRPCLILLDLMMPVMNGLEFLEAKNREDILTTIPVYIVSGVAEKPAYRGASGYIKKPIDFDLLLKVVHQFCGERRRGNVRES